VAGLAATGADSQTELFGVLGLGLVTVGGLTLLVRRRRVQG
jgi:LPXTG-motif cell wall-anchored protein